jgi:hypothetical protein
LRKKAKPVVLALLTLTMIYPLALYSSMKRYEAWMQTERERVPLDARQWIEFDPYFTSREGALFLTLGAGLVVFWLIIAINSKRLF